MLLIVSTVFVLLNLPDYDLRIQGFLVVGVTYFELLGSELTCKLIVETFLF